MSRLRLFNTSVCRSLILLISLISFAALGPGGRALATGAIVVNSNADGAPVDDDGVCTLRDAINAANNDAASGGDAGECAAGSGADTITFAGDYTITLTNGPLPVITTEITITGNGASRTIIEAYTQAAIVRSRRVFDIGAAGNLTLDGLTIRNGECTGSCATQADAGGGILNAGTLSINNVIITWNVASTGGGIQNTGTITNISNSVISNNTLDGSISGGGGIYNNGTITNISNTFFTLNQGSPGGGLYNGGTVSNLSSSTFYNNSATGNGGGIYNAGTITLISNNTFHNNTAGMSGGAIVNNSLITTINNSTFSGNSALVIGGISNFITISTISNTLIAANTGGNCGGDPTTSTADASDSSGCYSGWTNTVVPGTDYNTSLADNGCVTPLPDGSCVKTHAVIDHAGNPLFGTASGGTASDERGFPAYLTRDIGAFEFTGAFANAPTSLSATPAGTTQVDLEWTDNASNETGYKVQRSLAGAGYWTLLTTTSADEESYSDTTAICNTAYDYRVKATNAGGDSAASNVDSATTGSCGSPDISVTPSAYNFGNVVIGATAAKTFTAENSGTADLHISAIAVTGGGITNAGTGTCTASTTLIPSATCTVDIEYSPSGSSTLDGSLKITSDADPAESVTDLSGFGVTDHIPPELSSPKNGAPVTTAAVKLSWKSIKGASSYFVQVSDNIDFNGISDDGSVTKSPFTTEPLDPGRYYWRVATVDSAGQSDYSLPFRFDVTLAKTPANNGAVTTHLPKFSWTGVKGATTYHLQVFSDGSECDAGTNITFEKDAPKTSYTMASPDPALDFDTYYWRVRASAGTATTVYGPCWAFRVTTLKSPADGSLSTSFLPKFSWTAGSVSGGYILNAARSNPDGSTTPTLVNVARPSPSYTATALDGFGYGRYLWNITEVGSAFSAPTPDFVLFITAMTKPVNGTFSTDTTPAFAWKAVSGATAYTVEITDVSDPTFASPLRSLPAGTALKLTVGPGDALPRGVYLWRIHVAGPGVDMPAWTLTIGP